MQLWGVLSRLRHISEPRPVPRHGMYAAYHGWIAGSRKGASTVELRTWPVAAKRRPQQLFMAMKRTETVYRTATNTDYLPTYLPT